MVNWPIYVAPFPCRPHKEKIGDQCPAEEHWSLEEPAIKHLPPRLLCDYSTLLTEVKIYMLQMFLRLKSYSINICTSIFFTIFLSGTLCISCSHGFIRVNVLLQHRKPNLFTENVRLKKCLESLCQLI